MYSVVLLMALSGGAEAPDCHKSSCSCTCSGGYVVTTCHGYTSCSCSGSCHGGRRLFGHKSCHGCTGYTSCCGDYVVPACCGGVAPLPIVPMKPPEKVAPPKPKTEETAAPATIVLAVPTDAQVSIDGVATTSASATRTFVTPDLDPAQAFVYTLSAKIVRKGQTLTVSEQVSVRAGEQTRVNFGTEKFTTLTVAAK